MPRPVCRSKPNGVEDDLRPKPARRVEAQSEQFRLKLLLEVCCAPLIPTWLHVPSSPIIGGSARDPQIPERGLLIEPVAAVQRR